MAQDGSRIPSWIRGQLKSAHWTLEATMKDVNAEMAHWGPPGIARSLCMMMTPALAVDGVVKVSGMVPSVEEIGKIFSV